jgi:TonB family protein
MTRHLLVLSVLTALTITSANAQTGAARAPRPTPPATRPKVIATPTPAPTPAKPKPVRKKPPVKPVDYAASYIPTVKAAFAKRWAETVQPRMTEFDRGSASVKFKLDAEGKVTEFAVAENTSNEAFAKFCEQFVRETEFEKPPAKALKEGLIEIPFTFTIY